MYIYIYIYILPSFQQPTFQKHPKFKCLAFLKHVAFCRFRVNF